MQPAYPRGAARDCLTRCLWKKMKECKARGDDRGYMDCRSRLYEMYERLAFKPAAPYLGQARHSPADLLQECRLGLIEAIDRWKPDLGSLSTILYYRVRYRLQQYFKQAEMVTRPWSAYQQGMQETDQTADERRTAPMTVVAYDGMGSDSGDGWLEEMADPAPVISRHQTELRVLLDEAFTCLTPRQQEWTELRHGLAGRSPHTLQEIGDEYGCTRERVRQVLSETKPILAAFLEGCA